MEFYKMNLTFLYVSMNLTMMYVASLSLEVLFNRTDIFVDWRMQHQDCIDDPAGFVSLVEDPGQEIIIWYGCRGDTYLPGPVVGWPLLRCDGFSGNCDVLVNYDPVQSGEVNSNGVAYGGGSDQVRAFNLSNREFIWKKKIHYKCDDPYFPWTSPKVDMIFSDLEMLVVSVECTLMNWGLDLASGDLLWKEDVKPVAKLHAPYPEDYFFDDCALNEATRFGLHEVTEYDCFGFRFVCQAGSILLFHNNFNSDFWGMRYNGTSFTLSWIEPSHAFNPNSTCSSDTVCVTGYNPNEMNSWLACLDSTSGAVRCSTKIPEDGWLFLNGTEVWMTNSTGLAVYDTKSCSLRLFYKSFTPTRILFYADVALLLWAEGIYAVRLK
jgi:hypothetical protein